MNYVASFAALTLNVFNTGMALAGGGNLFGPNNTLSWFLRMMITSTGLGTTSEYAFEYALLAPLAAFMHYQREHEMQADRIGQEISFMAGYDLEKISQGWDDFSRFNEEFYAKEFSLKQKIFMSHPSFDRQKMQNSDNGNTKSHIGAYNLLQHSDCLFHALFHE